MHWNFSDRTNHVQTAAHCPVDPTTKQDCKSREKICTIEDARSFLKYAGHAQSMLQAKRSLIIQQFGNEFNTGCLILICFFLKGSYNKTIGYFDLHRWFLYG